MQFKLASTLGIPVFMLKTIMPIDEYKKWLIYLAEDEPDIPEMQLAVLSTLVSNALGGKAKVKDFLIRQPKQDTSKKQKGVSDAEVRGALGMFATKKA